MAKKDKPEAVEAEPTKDTDLSTKVKPLHEAHSAYIEDQTGVTVDPLHIFLVYSTRVPFRKTSDQYKESKSAAAEAKAAALAAKEEAKAEKAKEREEKKAAKEAEKAAKAEAAAKAAKAEAKGKKDKPEVTVTKKSTDAAPAKPKGAKKPF